MPLINLNLIKSDAGTQSRVSVSEETVSEYAERCSAGDEFPPVILFHDGTDYFLADGFHRVLAFVRAGKTKIEANVKTGTRLDALKFSLGANQSNGLRRTNADKRHCVQLALKEFPKLSDNAISKLCGVHNETVSAQRPQVTESVTSRHTGSDGKTYPAKQKSKPTPITEPEPEEEKPRIVAGVKEPEPEEPQPTSRKPSVQFKPSQGMTFAHMAISQLERIHQDDTQRNEAFNHVIAWAQSKVNNQ